jgi:hypothetical protein
MIAWILAALLVTSTPCETPRLHQYAQAKSVAIVSEFQHSSPEELQRAGSAGWQKLGENLGRGSSLELIIWGWRQSPTHRAILEGDWTHQALVSHRVGDITYAVLITELNPDNKQCVLYIPWNPSRDVSVV